MKIKEQVNSTCKNCLAPHQTSMWPHADSHVMFQTSLWRASFRRSVCCPAVSSRAARRPSSGSDRTTWCSSSSKRMTMTVTMTAAKSTVSMGSSPTVPPLSQSWYPTATPPWSSGRQVWRTEAPTGVMWAPRGANTMRRSSWRWKVSVLGCIHTEHLCSVSKQNDAFHYSVWLIKASVTLLNRRFLSLLGSMSVEVFPDTPQSVVYVSL